LEEIQTFQITIIDEIYRLKVILRFWLFFKFDYKNKDVPKYNFNDFFVNLLKYHWK